MISVGIDLAGKEKNITGFAVLKNGTFKTKKLFRNEEIIRWVKNSNPDIIAIDSPFSLPEEKFFRDCDLELIKMGFKVLSPRFKNMEILVKRCRTLLSEFNKMNFKAIEVFPRAVEKILGINKEKVEKNLGKISKDEFDAVLCAIMGRLYLKNEFRVVGRKHKIIIP